MRRTMCIGNLTSIRTVARVATNFDGEAGCCMHVSSCLALRRAARGGRGRGAKLTAIGRTSSLSAERFNRVAALLPVDFGLKSILSAAVQFGAENLSP